MSEALIRAERISDVAPIRSVISAAFAGVEHSNQTESLLVDELRDSGALIVSLVAEINDQIVGHVAFSPVMVNGLSSIGSGWRRWRCYMPIKEAASDHAWSMPV